MGKGLNCGLNTKIAATENWPSRKYVLMSMLMSLSITQILVCILQLIAKTKLILLKCYFILGFDI